MHLHHHNSGGNTSRMNVVKFVTLFTLLSTSLWSCGVVAQDNSDSLSFVLTGNTLEDLSTQLENEANKAFQTLEENPEDLPTVVSSMAAQVVSATTQLMLQFIKSKDENKDPVALAEQISQAIGTALQQATDSSTGQFASLDVQGIQQQIKNTVEEVVVQLSDSSSIEEIVESVGQQVLDIVGQAFAEVTGGKFSGTFALSNAPKSPSNGNKALNVSSQMDIVEITNLLRDSISDSIASVPLDAEIEALQEFLSNDLFKNMTQPMLQLVYSYINQGDLSALPSAVALTVKNALVSMQSQLQESPFSELDVDQVEVDVSLAVQEVISGNIEGSPVIDITRQVSEKAMNAIINGFNTAVISSTGSLILKSGDIGELTKQLRRSINSVLKPIPEDANASDIRNTVVTDLFAAMSQPVTSIVYTYFQDSSATEKPLRIAVAFETAVVEAIKGTLFEDIEASSVGDAVEEAVLASLNGEVREMPELTTDAASAAMNAFINMLLVSLGPSTVSIDSEIDPEQLGQQLVLTIQGFISSLSDSPSQNEKSTFQMNVLREVATAVSALTYSLLDYGRADIDTYTSNIVSVVKDVLEETKKAPGGYEDLDVEMVVELLEPSVKSALESSGEDPDLVAQQVAQTVVDVVAEEVSKVSKVLVTLAVSVSAQINVALESPETGKQAIINVLQGGNSVAIANAIVESLDSESETAISEALVLVLQEDEDLPDIVIGALATSFSIAQTTNPEATDVFIEVFIQASEASGPETLILPRLVTSAFVDSQEEVKDAFITILTQIGNRSDDGCGLLVQLLQDIKALADSPQDEEAIETTISESPKLTECLNLESDAIPPPPSPTTALLTSILFSERINQPEDAAQFIAENINSPIVIASAIVDATNDGYTEQVVDILKLTITEQQITVNDIAALIETTLVIDESQMLTLLGQVVEELASANDEGLSMLFQYSFTKAPENVQQAILSISTELVSQEGNCSILQPILSNVIQSATSPSEQTNIESTIRSQSVLEQCLDDNYSPSPLILLPALELPTVSASAQPSPPAPWFVGVISVQFQESLENPSSAADVIIDNIEYPTATARAIVDALEEGKEDDVVIAISLALNEEIVTPQKFGLVLEVVLQAGGPTALDLMTDVFSVADAGVLSLLIQYGFTEAPSVQESITKVLVELSQTKDCDKVNKIISNSLATAEVEERQAILLGLQSTPELEECLVVIDQSPEPQYTVMITMVLEQVIGDPVEAKQFIISNIQYPDEVAQALVSAIDQGRYLDVSQALVLVLQEESVPNEQLAQLFQVMLSLDSVLTLTLLSEVVQTVGDSDLNQPLGDLLQYALLNAAPEIKLTFITILGELVVRENCSPIEGAVETIQSDVELDAFIQVLNENTELEYCVQFVVTSPQVQEDGLIQKLGSPEEAKQFIVTNLNEPEVIAVAVVDAIELGKQESLAVVFQLLFTDTSVFVESLAELIKFITVIGDFQTVSFMSEVLDEVSRSANTELLADLIGYVFTSAPKDVKDALVQVITPIVGCGSLADVISKAIRTAEQAQREQLVNAFLETPGLAKCVDAVFYTQSIVTERNNSTLISTFSASLSNPDQALSVIIEELNDPTTVGQGILSILQRGEMERDQLVLVLVMLLKDESIRVDQISTVIEVVLAANEPQAISLLVQVVNEVARSGETQLLVKLVKYILLEASNDARNTFSTLLTNILALDATCGAIKEVVSEAVRQSEEDEAQQIVEFIRNSDDLYFCVDGALLLASTEQSLTYYKTKENGTVLVGGCFDLDPPSENANCAQQQQWGKCERKWMLSGSFCASTCNYCETECIDIQPDLQFTCEQRKESGQCEDSFMINNGFCKKTCGRCCSDIPPSSDFTCEQQKNFGKCGDAWMIAGNFCDRTCARCGGVNGQLVQTPSKFDQQIVSPPLPSPSPLPQPTPFVSSPVSLPDNGNTASCEDIPPNPWFPCSEWKALDMCDARWMTTLNYCAATCGRCPEKECTDTQPSDSSTCAQEQQWGNCEMYWMVQGDYCNKTCGRCTA